MTSLLANVSRDQSLFGVYWGRVCSPRLWRVLPVIGDSSAGALHLACGNTISSSLVSASDLIGMSLIWIAGQAFQAFERLN